MNYAPARSAALPDRRVSVRKLKSRTFDVAVIGGGITGAGIALDAATRGLSVALIEKGDYASGTSSKSTKLIHGGLRYLKQLDVALVREVGQERAAVHRLAPHLVQPEKMFIPIIKGGQMGKLTTSVALWVYDKLAGVEGEDQRRMLDREEALAAEPMLDGERVTGGAIYAEYRTDDARLTIENLKTAAALGAVSANYCEAVSLIHNQEGKVVGLDVRDHLTEEVFELNAATVINAAGPWVDFIREIDRSLEGKRVFHAKGVHFVVRHERFPVRQSIYFDLPDGRMCFAIPREGATYFGTTDTPFEADPDQVTPDGQDLDYLLHGVNAMFPGLDLREDEIESSWAGLRPLIFEPGKSASEMSRRDEIFESASGLLSIAGGKLTGYRKMSERIMDLVTERIGRGGATQTSTTALAGNDFADFGYVVAYRDEVAQMLRAAELPVARAAYLVHLYGIQTPQVLAEADPSIADPELRLLVAELDFAIEREQVQRLEDFAIRRTGRLYFDKGRLDAMLPALMDHFARRRGLSAAAAARELASLQQLSRAHETFGESVPA